MPLSAREQNEHNEMHALRHHYASVLLTLANFADTTPALDWLTYWPIAELGSILAGAGLLGIGYNYLVDRDKDAVDDERTRRLLKEAAPDFRDAVVKGL